MKKLQEGTFQRGELILHVISFSYSEQLLNSNVQLKTQYYLLLLLKMKREHLVQKQTNAVQYKTLAIYEHETMVSALAILACLDPVFSIEPNWYLSNFRFTDTRL